MRVGILTNFSEWLTHYSLTSVVGDQIRMILDAGHTPELIVMENFSLPAAGHPDFPILQDLTIHRAIPFHHKKDYMSLKDVSEEHVELARAFTAPLAELTRSMDAVLTHDIVATGWNLVVHLAMRHVCNHTAGPLWMHWIHSVPGGGKRDYWGVPANSVLVYPNHADALRCAEHYSTAMGNVLVCPHSKDVRHFLVHEDDACTLLRRYDILHADIIQTLPVPTDRMEFKGIAEAISLFAEFKKKNRSVRLIVVNSWCTTPQLREKVEYWRAYAHQSGLTDNEVIFTSREFKSQEVGMPLNFVRDMMLISNLFICASKSETFGFTIAEAALTGQLLVLNASWPAMMDLAGSGSALFFTFGSNQQTVNNSDWPKFYGDIAQIILHRMDTDAALTAKSHYRKRYNRDTVWQTLENAIRTHLGARIEVRR